MKTQSCSINRPYKGHTAHIDLAESRSRCAGTPSRSIWVSIFDADNALVDSFVTYTQGYTVKALRRYAKDITRARIDEITTMYKED